MDQELAIGLTDQRTVVGATGYAGYAHVKQGMLSIIFNFFLFHHLF